MLPGIDAPDKVLPQRSFTCCESWGVRLVGTDENVPEVPSECGGACCRTVVVVRKEKKGGAVAPPEFAGPRSSHVLRGEPKFETWKMRMVALPLKVVAMSRKMLSMPLNET